MALKPTAQWANVRRSLDVYFASQFDGTYPIDWEGVPFNDAELAEWLQPRLFEPVRPRGQFMRQVGAGGERGQGLLLLYQVNVFVRPSLQPASLRVYRLAQLRDVVLGAFTEHTKITMTDYVGGSGSLGTCIVDGQNMDREIPDPTRAEELQQWGLGFDVRWWEGWT